jgi:hypothetical protein
MSSRCPDCGAAIGEPHLYGCEREACAECGGVLMACGCLLRQLPDAVQRQCGGEICFLPQSIWGPLLTGKRRPYPYPPRRTV